MTETKREVIRRRALEIVGQNPNGIRFSELLKRIHKAYPDFPINTLRGSVWNLDAVFPDAVYKAARGVFRHKKYAPEAQVPKEAVEVEEMTSAGIREGDFYEPFAEWIKNDLEECTKAIPLGGSVFKDRWGTPDVIGIREPKKSDIVKPPTEIVSAEIKIEKTGLVTAFGQACSYMIFSHKSYIVVPRDSSEEDIARLDVLCRIVGLGLILFDSSNAETPDFKIRVRAHKHEPDMFYVNKYMRLIEGDLFA